METPWSKSDNILILILSIFLVWLMMSSGTAEGFHRYNVKRGK